MRRFMKKQLWVFLTASVFMLTMSAMGNVQKTSTSLHKKTETGVSLFFIIDNSGSMDQQDRMGQRFSVASAFLDSLMQYFPDNTEVGVATFRQYLYYYGPDDLRFIQCPDQDTGSYIPFLKLDTCYTPDGIKGYDILKKYLASTTTQPVGLSYTPTNTYTNAASTCINAGFDAAKHAFQSARYAKERQFIIFFSDGEANIPGTGNNPLPESRDFIRDVKEGIPTTFTIYFNIQGDIPPTLDTMTANVKASTYSTINDSSNIWSINLGTVDLMNFLSKHIFPAIIQPERVPRLIQDASPILEKRPTFTWHAPQISGTSYEIQIFSSLLGITGYTKDTFYTVDQDLTCGTIEWRVRTDISAWSYKGTLILLDDRVPFLTRYDGQKVTTAQPLFTWLPVTGATSYKVVIADNNAFLNSASYTLTATSFTSPASLANGRWYWKVSCSIDLENYSPADSVVVDFTTIHKTVNINKENNVVVLAAAAGLHISLNGNSSPFSVAIYSLTGKYITTIKSQGKQCLWDYSDGNGGIVGPGFYLLNIAVGNKLFVRKIVINR